VFNGYVDLSPLPTFLAAVGLILIAPGPDMAYMVGAGLAGGRSAATRAAFGIASGVAVYVVAVAAGLGALVASHTGVLVGMQFVGAAYLAWLAYNAVQPSRDGSELTADAAGQHWFRRGFVVNLTNPKIALFFLAFLPQFLGTATSPTLQLLTLGVFLQMAGLAVDLLVGWAAGAFRDRVFQRPRTMRALTLTSAFVFAALAILVVGDVMRRLA
jgi:threonine/homoserine/homoserine lactone efflux protein